MAQRKRSATLGVARHPFGGAARHARPPARRPRRLPRLKVTLFGAVVLSLAALFGVALSREVATSRDAARPRPAVISTPRPALTADEEAYAQALWPLHNQVKATALRMTFGGINYKTGRLDRAGLKGAVDAALASFRQSERQIEALQPPPSLRQVHDDYLGAVRLYVASATEMLKVADDGDDDHLLAAFPLSQEAGKTLLRVGGVLWPGEYVPN